MNKGNIKTSQGGNESRLGAASRAAFFPVSMATVLSPPMAAVLGVAPDALAPGDGDSSLLRADPAAICRQLFVPQI